MHTHTGNSWPWRVTFSRLRIVLFGLLPFFVAGQDRKAAAAPDVLVVNAHVITMDPAKPTAGAIAIQGDSIVWVGSSEQAKKLFSATVRVIDLHGATVLPGIIDAHTHLMSLGESFLKLNLKDAPTQKQVIELVRQKAASAPPSGCMMQVCTRHKVRIQDFSTAPRSRNPRVTSPRLRRIQLPHQQMFSIL